MHKTFIEVNPSSSWSWAWPSSAPACFLCKFYIYRYLYKWQECCNILAIYNETTTKSSSSSLSISPVKYVWNIQSFNETLELTCCQEWHHKTHTRTGKPLLFIWRCIPLCHMNEIGKGYCQYNNLPQLETVFWDFCSKENSPHVSMMHNQVRFCCVFALFFFCCCWCLCCC